MSRAGFVPLRVGYSERDASVQLLAVKGEKVTAGNHPLWRDDAALTYAHVNADRKRHYLMLPLLLRRLQREGQKRRAVARYGRSFFEFEAPTAEVRAQ